MKSLLLNTTLGATSFLEQNFPIYLRGYLKVINQLHSTAYKNQLEDQMLIPIGDIRNVEKLLKLQNFNFSNER